ncbi:LexA family transcriptional regulator [Legionella nagasakiensis]|uniref:LexA family transcriptional regulator n=1 Tax=Legionella nagasakiensis TaxID=535290 RepID=UPI001056ACD6|nr:LexA family transcriptional regulator [Legionella nagasakiensis]
MAELNIKKEIGKRILEARKAKGLTLKALGELAGNLKQTRLTNWEQGTRAPGPEEIKQLARALDVSPAYLMCLSDDQQKQKQKNHSHLIPLLDHQQVGDSESNVGAISQKEAHIDTVFISVSNVLLPRLSKEAFALKMDDESMHPEIRVDDILVIEPLASPKPGSFVAVKIEGAQKIIICQYKKLSFATSDFELMTLNDNWPNVQISDELGLEIKGVVLQKITSLS